MLKVKVQVDGSEKLKKHIEFVDTLINLSRASEFQKYLQEKCLNITKETANFYLSNFTTTNEDLYGAYLDSIHIGNADEKGFSIISNLEVEKPTTDISIGYVFNVSMAFEYGTGIMGLEQGIEHPSSWKYNVNDHHVIANNQLLEGWWLSVEKNGNNPYFGVARHGKAVVTMGYEGMEIFRNSAIEINSHIGKWVNDYLKKYGGVSK